MSMQFQFIGQLVAGAAYLALAYAFFILAERLRSGEAKVAAVAFGYCGVGLLAQVAASLSHYVGVGQGLARLSSSPWFHLIVGGLRPLALLLAAICAIRVARAIAGVEYGSRARDMAPP